MKNYDANSATRGRELAVARYTLEKIIPQYIAFYEKVLKQNRQRLKAIQNSKV